MKLDFEDQRPIFIQIAEGIEDGIMLGAYPEGEQIPSTTEISTTLRINPATALKGINILVEDGVIYKRRGLGMFVAQGAVEKLRGKRKNAFYDEFVMKLTHEAKRLGLTLEETIDLIERGYRHE